MSEESDLIELIDLIHEALLDGNLWPRVLVRLADATGAAQISMTSRDQQTGMFTTLSPRTDPDWIAAYSDYWRHHNPLWRATFQWPAGETYSLDSLMPRRDFSVTPVFNEWWRPSGRGLAAIGANILAKDRFSSLIYIANGPGESVLSDRQISVFKTALRHIIWAVRINRRLWDLELKHLAPPEQLEALPRSALLLDASARVVLANAAAKEMLDEGDGIVLRNGHLSTLSNGRFSTINGSDDLQELIAACAQPSGALGRPGCELRVLRTPPSSPLHVTVTPLGVSTRLTAIPWLGVGVPVALVTVNAPDSDRQRQQTELCQRYCLTPAEAVLAAEISKGDGRMAAARRCNITDATAKTHLAHIFEKTGTHRQAELVRLLLDGKGTRTMDAGHPTSNASVLTDKASFK
ncbi:MAG TPA: helix-turn-helix transcriptional regulator [Methylocella sp.]|nr:helix-turn-helix transcriptional regulator [Methylocella sp.]